MLEKIMSPPIIYGIIAAAAIVILSFLYKLFRPKEEQKQMVRMKCRRCGWSGAVGKYNKKCSRCGSSDLKPF